MEACWRVLPRDLVERVLLHLDAGTRRDLNMRPRRLGALPQLELHRDKLSTTGEHSMLTITKEEGAKVFQLIWPSMAFFYQRTNRYKFMLISGAGVWRDGETHHDLLAY